MYTDAEIANMTDEQLAQVIQELDIKQTAVKLIINSLYGAFGNKYFYFNDPDIAASITLQSQDLIKYSISIVNHYFRNLWHKDVKAHERLNVSTNDIKPIEKDVAIYCDTDSTYVNFQPMIESMTDVEMTKDEALKFCIKFIDTRFADYLNRAFESYALHTNTKNQQQFKLENISESGIWIAKKNYVLKVKYDGEAKIIYDEPKIKAKGVDMAKPSFPAFTRDKMKIIFDILLDKGKKVNIEEDIIPKLKEYRQEFDMLDADDVCLNKFMRVYDKYVPMGGDVLLDIPSGMPFNSKAALYHNYLIEHTNIRKYKKIREGQKMKIYHAEDDRIGYEQIEVFGYIPGQYPHEFAPKVNRKKQFFVTLVESINKGLNAMGLHQLNEDLQRDIPVVKIQLKREVEPEEVFPMYVINEETLEYIEVPESINPYLDNFKTMQLNTAKMPQDVYMTYVDYISKFGVNTRLVPKMQLEKYIARIEKKQENDRIMELDKAHLQAEYEELTSNIYNVTTNIETIEKIGIPKLENELEEAKTNKDKELIAQKRQEIKDAKDAVRSYKKDLKEHEVWKAVYLKAADSMRKKYIQQQLDDAGV